MRRTLRPLAALVTVALFSTGNPCVAHVGTTRIMGGIAWTFSR
jgi:hypothetical protein